MNSVKNGRTPSGRRKIEQVSLKSCLFSFEDDDRVARKRFKLESLDEYLDLPWTVDKRLLTPEATTMTDMHDMHLFPFDFFSLNEETNAVPHRLRYEKI